MRGKKVLISEGMVEKLARGEVRFKRDFKLKYGRYCLLDLSRVLRRFKLGSKGEGEVNQ